MRDDDKEIQKIIEENKLLRAKRIKIGRIALFSSGIISLIFTLVSSVVALNLLILIWGAIGAIWFLCCLSFSKYVYVWSNAFLALYLCYVMLVLTPHTNPELYEYLLLLAHILYLVFNCIYVMKSVEIKEYIYERTSD